jgi:uncharacterized protein (DUF488 family)
MIFSIGHGNRDILDFVSLLHEYKIEYLIDVRSSPYSKHSPLFNKVGLSAYLKNIGLTYVFLGDKLGGLPKDPTCYINYVDKKDQKVKKIDYSKIENKDFFQQGIERLKTAESKGLKIAVMCSELNPEECHRSKLIGVVLLKDGIVMQHINKEGKIQDQNEINLLINKGSSPINLWGEIDLTSKRKIH